MFFFFSSRRRHTRWPRDWSSDVCSSDLSANLASIQSQIPPDLAAKYASLTSLKGSLTFAGVGGIPSTPANKDLNNIQPRIGFAYQVREKLVMRGGVGLYYSNPDNGYLQSAGFATSTDLVNSFDRRRTF